MLTVVAFIIARGLLIAVHEYGQYRVAAHLGGKAIAGIGRGMMRHHAGLVAR